jgi:hypothetical protein
MTLILDDVVAEGERLLEIARREAVPLHLLGGVAVRLHAPDVPPALAREYKDIDFAVPKKGAGAADKLLRDAGYNPHLTFNAMHARERALFFDDEHDRQVDVFIGSFRMCHQIPLGARIDNGEPTVPLAELLLTKLQIIEVNEKDIRDMVLLLHGHGVGEHDDDTVNVARISELCAAEWGLWRTITANLERCRAHVADYDLDQADRDRVTARFDEILARIDEEPKSRGWKLRSKIGERRRWYELPEEVEQ